MRYNVVGTDPSRSMVSRTTRDKTNMANHPYLETRERLEFTEHFSLTIYQTVLISFCA